MGSNRKMCRILIADDYEPVRRLVGTIIGSRKGWLVCGEAADGLQAIERANLLCPDLIIMDVSMPKMNGLDAARIILREQPKTRVLIVSQNDPDIVRRQSVEANAQGFVSKSNLHAELIETIERILSADGPPTIGKAS